MRGRVGWIALAGVAVVGVPAPITRATQTSGTPYPGGTWQPPAPTYGVYADKNVPVTMSDGATLTVDVYYPADPATGLRAAGTFPALLTQTPYTGSIGATQ